MTILKDRLEKVLGMSLAVSSHASIETGLCIMEAVSYVAGEPWADHPKCTCPILTEYAIRLNDRFNDEDRQKLKPLIPLLIGTRTDDDSTRIARKRFLMWRNVTTTYPLILDAIGAKDYAAKLRTFENTKPSMAEAASFLKEHRAAIRKLADAYAYANADANANANAYAYANANANAYAYANANANANAYAYAYAYAYAKKFRASLADIAIESLRLAIEVKIDA